MDWQTKADKEWSRVIKEVGHCEWCGQSDEIAQMHAHHIIKRTNFNFRHLIENGHCLCASCHSLGHSSAHKDRTAYLEWFELRRPGQWKWYMDNTVTEWKEIGNRTILVYKPKKIRHEGDKAEYEMLKEIRK